MIELGALLGALVGTHVAFATALNDTAPMPGLGVIFGALCLLTLLGALWGAAVAAVIHFIADGTALSMLLALPSFLHSFHHSLHA